MIDSPRSVLVMGVSGCGKSQVGRLLAKRIGAEFVDADDHHSPASIAKMSRGQPLTDADRANWLEDLAGLYRRSRERGIPLVIGCSALKRDYRDVLRRGAPNLQIVHLHGERELLLARMDGRRGHFFRGSALLDSQLRDLEPPSPDEALQVDISLSPEAIVEQAAQHLTR